jgi:uncharacterized membrane protein YphA (DoxX/SURF4 family)
MLNPFPDLLTYSLLAPFLLRLIVGFVFIDLGVLLFKKENERWILSFKTLRIPKPIIATKILAIIQVAGGAMLIVGLYTQIAALVLGILTFIEVYLEYKDPSILKRNIVFYMLVFTILLSLLLSGAGAFAIDLPL